MKKMLCMLLVLLMLPLAAIAETENTWEFDYDDYALEGYSGPGGDIVVPDYIDGCPVEIIRDSTFREDQSLTSVALPETLRQVEDTVLSFCYNLRTLTLPFGLQVVGDTCFTGNSALEELVIPASVCYIGNDSFSTLESLRTVIFEGECPVFDGYAFDYLGEDTIIYVPDDQYDVYVEALNAAGCWYDIQPSGNTAIVCGALINPEDFDFDPATGTILSYLGFDARVDVPSEIDGVPVKAIGSGAFSENSYVCYVTLPEGIEQIGEDAFAYCESLVYVDFPSTLKTIGDRAFAQGYYGYGLELPEGLEHIGAEAFATDYLISKPLVLPKSLKTIGEGAFMDCSWLSEVYIPASVVEISENAFANSGMGYLAFEGIEMPKMAESALSGCYYLSDIDLHHKASKQQMLDFQAVVDGLNLSCRVWRMQNPDVEYIEDGLDVYENGVMLGYSGELTHIRPWDTFDDIIVTTLGDGAFKDNDVIQYFSVPYSDEFTTIGAEAFAGSTLHTIDLFDSVTTIGEGAFRNCEFLTELTLPASVTSVGEGLLDGCVELKRIVVECDAENLPDDLFEDLPEDVEIYAAADASKAQVKRLSEMAGREWYLPVLRLGEEAKELYAMPYEPTYGGDFWYDADFARLDRYMGYERNLILPRHFDGIMFEMVGGDVMGRAAYGDNYEMELPVVSLVIPETYTEIPYYAFENCETLEVVVCYAPLELLPDNLFKNCTALRQVVFVNGVHNIGAYVFDGCTSLEYVYLGEGTDAISEYAFLNEDGSVAFDADACITDPAALPDIDAMLEAVKCDPMPIPEPEPEVEDIEFAPVGDEGAAYFGGWIGDSIVVEGTAYTFAEFGMDMSIVFNSDGSMYLTEAGESEIVPWKMDGGIAFAMDCGITIADDGRLCIDDGSAQMYFVRGEVSDMPVIPPVAVPPVDEPAGQIPSGASGQTEVKYVCINADVEGFVIDASMLGGEYSLTFHENGSADFVVVGAPMPSLSWSQADNANFILDYFGTKMEIVWTDAGFDMNYFDTMMLHFVPAA